MKEVASASRSQRVGAQRLPFTSRTPWTRLWLLIPGGPKSVTELRDLGAVLAHRFDRHWENALAYVDKSYDRLLNKARGLLTFDGLVLAALGTVYREGHGIPPSLVLAGGVCAVIASGILLLTLFSVSIGDLSEYRNAESEFPHGLTRLVIGGKSNVFAGLFSLVAMVCLLTALGMVVLRDHLR